MLNREQFDKLKHKARPTMQDVAVLIVTVEQLLRTNDLQAIELKRCLKSLDALGSRLRWYQTAMTIKEATRGD